MIKANNTKQLVEAIIDSISDKHQIVIRYEIVDLPTQIIVIAEGKVIVIDK